LKGCETLYLGTIVSSWKKQIKARELKINNKIKTGKCYQVCMHLWGKKSNPLLVIYYCFVRVCVVYYKLVVCCKFIF